MQILRSIILFLVVVSSCFSQEPKPNQEICAENVNVETVNLHLQQNYKLPLHKKLGLILTGFVIKDDDKSIGSRAYTNFKIEF